MDQIPLFKTWTTYRGLEHGRHNLVNNNDHNIGLKHGPDTLV